MRLDHSSRHLARKIDRRPGKQFLSRMREIGASGLGSVENVVDERKA
jgi:hypothetical protein